MNLKTLSGGIVNDMSLTLAEAHMYFSSSVQSLVGKNSRSGLPMGMYAAFHSDVLSNLASIAKMYCEQFIGVVKAVGGPVRCPPMKISKAAKLGIYAQPVSNVGFELNLPGFKLTCRVSAKETQCGFADKYFAIVGRLGGFVVKKLAKLHAAYGDEVMKVAAQTVDIAKGFSKVSSISSINSGNCVSNYAKKKFKNIKKFFGGRGGGHKEVEFGFKKKYKCKGTTETLFDSGNSQFDSWFNEFRNDGKGECFNQCYLHAVKRGGNIHDSNICCEFRKHGNNNKYKKCIYGTRGREDTGDSAKMVSMSVVSDFEEELNARDPGESCSKDRDCESGVCHGGQCKDACDPEFPCQPGQQNAYCDNDDQCASGGFCFDYVCHTGKFGYGHRAGHGHHCQSGFVANGVCMRKCSSSSKCNKDTAWAYCDKDKHCSGKKAKCKSHKCNK